MISISGIRGIFGHDLRLDDVIRFNKKFGRFLKSLGFNRCIIARDTKTSSKIISNTAIATLLTFGIDIYNLNIAPTPFAFREARKYDAGLMVTSSHNPLEWNGLKFIIQGRGLFEDELTSLLSLDEPNYDRIGKEHTIKSGYLDEIKFNLNCDARVAIDNTGGAATDYAERLLSKIGCKVYSIHYNNPDYPDPTSKDLTNLKNLILSSKSNIGFAYDLDGDRVVVMDEHGNKLNPDTTLLLTIAKSLDLKLANKFAVSIDTSNAIKDFLERRGCSLIYSKVGEANLIKVMLNNSIEVGGEGSSGGFVFTRFNMCRDGLLASALIASMIGSKDYQECIELSNKYTIIRTKIGITDRKDIISAIENRLERDSYEISRLDGIKGYIDDNTWILIRSSNTEDVIRLSIESDDPQKAKNIYKHYERLIRESIH